MGSQSLGPQLAQARPMAMHPNNGLMGSGGIGKFSSLARQTSIYSLTLDEFQNAITEPGKNFGSMNMDEFLKNIWTVEESQAMASAMAGEGSGEGKVVANTGGLARQTSSAAQTSLAQPSLSLPRTLSRKTVDEVWRDIQWNSTESGGEGGDAGGDASQHHKSTTFGEMTLEDFLVKAGVVREEGEPPTQQQSYGPFSAYAGNGITDGNNDRSNEGGERSLVPTLSLSTANAFTSPQPAVEMSMDAYKHGHAQQQAQQDWIRKLQQQQAFQQQHMIQAQAEAAVAYGNAMSKRLGNGALVPTMGGANGGYAGLATALAPGLGQMTVPGMGMGAGTLGLALLPGSPASPASDSVAHSHGNGLSLSPIGNYGMEGFLRGRKRVADGAVEKVVERRQRRMIKNRESAARSRARKQAYTVELEAEVTQLKEENARLRKQQEEEALRRKKMVLESIERSVADGKRALRRTKTGPW